MTCGDLCTAKACGFHSVAHKHGDGHGADAAGHRGEKAGGVNGVGMNVANQDTAFFAEFFQTRKRVVQQASGFRGIGNFVGAHIDDGGAGADPVGLNETRFAHGGNQNIGAAHDFGKIARFGMANGDGGVCMHEEKRHGFADDITSAKDNGVGAFDGDLVATQNFHAAGGSAGDESGTTGDELAEIDRVEAIDVFRRSNRFKDAFGIDLGGKRKLNQDAVNIVVIVQVGDELKHVVGGSVGWRKVKPMGHAELLAGSDFVFDINVGGGILTNENRSKAGTNALGVKAGDVLFELRENFVANFQAIEDLRGHGKSITREVEEFPRMGARHLLPCAAKEEHHGDHCKDFPRFGI